MVGIRKHGPGGILVRAAAGVVLNAAILILAGLYLPTISRVEQAVRQQKARTAVVPFSLTAPPGFVKHQIRNVPVFYVAALRESSAISAGFSWGR